jgi:hypothetical protein
MELRWGTTCFEWCRISVNIVPFFAVLDLHQNQNCYHQKSHFPEALVQATLDCVGHFSIQMGDLDISVCVWIWRWSLLCLLNEINNRWVVLRFAPNLGNGKRHMPWTIHPSCEKRHMHYTTNMRGPTFILVTNFTPKIKIITFINERG